MNLPTHTLRLRRALAHWGGFALLALALGFAPGALAQTGTITGTVTDDQDEPVIQANIYIPELDRGTATDLDGSYRIENVPAGTYTLQASYTGFETLTTAVTIAAGATVVQDFELVPRELGNVVVTGYRVTRAPVESGATSFVEGRDIQNVPARSATEAAQGRLSGVRITGGSGIPGAAMSVQVRGTGSITAGSQPLYIVDGVQLSNDNELGTSRFSTSPLSGINPQDIESIEVLKDAAATSIYGAEAANGVVLVTTRRGQRGRTQIEFGTQLGTRSRIRNYEVLNAEQFLDYQLESLVNRYGFTEAQAFPYIDSYWGQGELVDGQFVPTSTIDTNWQDAFYGDGFTQQYTLSARGGGEETQFFVSGQYTNDESQVRAAGLEQAGLRLNLDHSVNSGVQLEAGLNVSTTEQNGSIVGGTFTNGPTFAIQFIPPTAPIYVDPDDPESGYNLEPDPFGVFATNPLAQADYNSLSSTNNQILGNVAANVEVFNNLFGRTFVGVNHYDAQQEEYRDPRLPTQRGAGNSASASGVRTTELNASQTFSYSTLFNADHNVSVLGGVEYRRGFRDQFGAGGNSFPTFQFRTLSTAANPTNVTQTKSEFRRFSTFGNAEYTFDNRYQLAGTLRYDGSSRFGEEQRFGLFGTIAGFWRISEEGFAQGLTLIDDLKLRASYGTTGNSEIGNYAALSLFSGSGEYGGLPGVRLSNLANNFLTWEERTELNVGLDFSFFRNLVSGSVDAYQAAVNELLLSRDLPADAGISTFTENIGQVDQRGLEFGLRTTNVQAGGFEWVTNFNISFQESEVTSLASGDDEIVVGGLFYRVGEAPGQLNYVRYAGVNPANGRPMYYDIDGNLTYQVRAEDRVLQGNAEPDYFGGLGNTFSYGGLSLDVFFQGDFGRTLLNTDAILADIGSFGYVNRSARVLDRWREPGDVTEMPRAQWGGIWPDGTSENTTTSRFVEDGSYIRLKQVTLSYNVPTSLIAGLPVAQSAQIYLTGSNLLTWSNFTGEDPEVAGINYVGVFPQPKTLIAGFRLGL